MTFELGGLRFTFRSPDSRWADLLGRCYGAFAVPGEAAFVVELDTTKVGPGSPDSLRSLMEEPLEISLRAGVFRATALSFSFEADLVRGEAQLAGPLHRFPIDTLIRYLLPLLLSDGLVVHSLFLAEDNRGWLCTGPSGSGKSTLGGLLPSRAFCDELAVVRKVESGFESLALPYWRGRPRSARLAGIYLLRHGDQTDRRRLPTAIALRRLCREVQWPAGCASALERSFETLGRMVETCPIWELRFQPSPEVWTVISQEAVA